MGLKELQSAKVYKYFWKKNRLRKSHKGQKSKNAEHYYPCSKMQECGTRPEFKNNVAYTYIFKWHAVREKA